MKYADKPIRKILLQEKIDAILERRREGQAVAVIALGLGITNEKVTRVLNEFGLCDGEDLRPKKGNVLKKTKVKQRCPICGCSITTKECIGCSITANKKASML